MEVQETEVQTDRVITVPNILSFMRLLGVPLFLWLILVPEADGWAIVVLVFAGISDYLDGKIARKWNQISRVGQILDPLADRLYILATLIGLLLRGIIPWWLVAVLVGRDLIMGVVLAVLKKRTGLTGLPVHFIGKAATFCLLYAFPLILLGAGTGTLADVCRVFGWAFALWGTGLYLWAAVLYLEQAARVLRGKPNGTSSVATG
ncbi:MAG: CDP-alcohol phosphatidyltransferase family protein [Candidatus Nanopelagicales bacterium]